MNRDIIVAELSPLREHFYRRYISFKNGAKISGYLTYSLGTSNTGSRSLLLVNSTIPLSSDEQKKAYSTFCKTLDSINGHGTFGKVKSYASHLNLNPNGTESDVILAVHKFGPVPVFDTGLDIQTTLDGQNVSARIAIYHHPAKWIKKNQHHFTASPNDELLIQSLDGNMEIVFRRYYEDVAYRIHDIVHSANLDNAIKWSKEVETTIASSIKSKLRVISPSDTEKKGFNEWKTWSQSKHRLSNSQFVRRKFFEENSAEIYKSIYFRLSVLYLLNCLYAEIGISSRRKQYRDRLENLNTKFRGYFGDNFVKNTKLSSPDLSSLSHYLHAYINKSEDQLYHEEKLSNWVSPIVELIRLLYWLDKFKTSPEKARIFLSYHHEVPESELTKDRIIKYIQDSTNTGMLEPLSLSSNERNRLFKERIKALIWMSDKTASIIVNNPQQLGTKAEKGFSWIASESEHTLQQGKHVIFLKQKGVDESTYSTKLENLDYSFLVENVRQDSNTRKRSLVDEWENHAHTPFSITGMEVDGRLLDINIQDTINTQCQKLVEERVAKRLRGYLSQFSKHHVTFLTILSKKIQPNNLYYKKDILKELDSSSSEIHAKMNSIGYIPESLDKLFVSTYQAFRKRTIAVQNESHRPITLVNGRRYQLTLLDLITAMSDSSLDDKNAKRILDNVLSEFDRSSRNTF